MLRKLMKYEFKATGRIFLPLFAALMIISVINRLLMYIGLKTPGVIGIVVSVVLIVGIIVLTLILTIQRFRQNLLSSEGYLMMTLPTEVDSHILCKMIVAAAWVLVSLVVVTISILIMALADIDIESIRAAVKVIANEFNMTAANFKVCAVEIAITAIIGLFSGILMLYACMSLSMLVNRRRGLFSFGAYIVINSALQMIAAILFSIVAMTSIYDAIERILHNTSAFMISQIAILIVFLAEAVLCVVFYIITRYMLKKRLNLQ